MEAGHFGLRRPLAIWKDLPADINFFYMSNVSNKDLNTVILLITLSICNCNSAGLNYDSIAIITVYCRILQSWEQHLLLLSQVFCKY